MTANLIASSEKFKGISGGVVIVEMLTHLSFSKLNKVEESGQVKQEPLSESKHRESHEAWHGTH